MSKGALYQGYVASHNIPHFLHVLFEAAVLASLNNYGYVETQNEAFSLRRILPSGGL